MELKNQVCSLELAKKLKELGVEQDSLFYWRESKRYGKEIVGRNMFETFGDNSVLKLKSEKGLYEGFSAFTVAELGEIMKEENMVSGYSSEDMAWYCETYHDAYPAQDEPTEADARAKMLIYLLENNLIKEKL